MPFANNDGVRIHYKVEGAGQPLVLQHGLTSNLDRWYTYGYVEALKEVCRLIMIDARGHGKSDKPYDPGAYDRKAMASDVIAVLDAENIVKSHYLGYSMGGSIGFGIAETFPERVYSMIIGGMHPYPMTDVELKPGVYALDSMMEHLAEGMDAYVEAMDPQPDPERKTQLLSNDPKSILAATVGLRDRPDLSSVLQTMNMPCLVYAGDVDGLHADAERCVASMPNVTWVSLPGLDHGAAMERADQVLPHIIRFLSTLREGIDLE